MIEIHRVTCEDLVWLNSHRNNPEVYDYFNQYREISMEEQIQWYHELPNSFHPFVIWHNDKRIGYVALKDINNILRSAEFSIFIAPIERNNGYGTQALKDLLRYGFGTLNLMVIHSLVFSFNKAIKLYKEIGFKVDGTLRRTCYKHGKYYDSYYISLLREEHDELHNCKQ